MVTNLSFTPVLLESLNLLWIKNTVPDSPIEGDQLGMGYRGDRALTSAPELEC